MQTRQVEGLGGRRASAEMIELDRRHDHELPLAARASPRLAILCAGYPARFLAADRRARAGRAPWNTLGEKLFGRYRQTEFDQPHVSGRITLVDMPAAKNALVVVARVVSAQRPEPHRKAVFPRAVDEIQI